MLTPKFEISQCDLFVKLKIHAPYTSVAAVELVVIDNTVSFYAKPYLLKLAFPNDVQEEGSSCQYNADNGDYLIHIKKTVRGEVFPNLDLLTTLFCPKNVSNSRPLIEVVNNSVDFPDQDKKVSISWETNQDENVSNLYGLGFANKLRKIDIEETLQEVIFLRNPNKTSLLERHAIRIESENVKFDSDHYLADLYEDEEINELLTFKPWWKVKKWNACYSSIENEILQKLPNREYLLDDLEKKMAFLGLVDILFGFVYNSRETEAENSTESAWSICTVSSTLSWCATSLSVRDLLITSYRRLLCYPQHRSWNLADQLKRDVIKILRHGRRCVLKCFLEILSCFRDSDSSPYYLLNDLYISDYCVWIQKHSNFDEDCVSLANALDKEVILKSHVDLELDLIEEAARLVVEEDSLEKRVISSQVEHEQLVNNLESLTL